MDVFNYYARYYDLLNKDKNYQAEVDYVISLIEYHAPQARRILELGCGTGIHAKLFAEAGYQVSGIDFSEKMLNVAIKRRETLSTDLQRKLNFTQADVRTYRSSETFDIVLSLFHVFSYQTSNSDLKDAFQTASKSLEDGGVLIFDYWYGPAVLTQRPETRVKRLNEEEFMILRTAESFIDDVSNTVEVNYEILVNNHGSYDTFSESHKIRYLFIPEIELLAEMFNFEVVTHLCWLGKLPPSTDTWSGVTVLRKKH